MTNHKSYNPKNCSEKRFYKKLLENKLKLKSIHLYSDGLEYKYFEPVEMTLWYDNPQLDLYAKVYFRPYSQLNRYSNEEKEKIGCVLIYGHPVRNFNKIISDLERLCGIKLLEVKND